VVAVRRRQLSPVVADGGLAVLLAVFTQVELALADQVDGPMVVQSLAFASMTLAVAWRRSAPQVAGVLAGAGLAVQTVTGNAEVVGGFLALLIVMYSVASYQRLRPALVAGGVVLAGVFVYPLVNDLNVADEIGNAAIFLGAWGLGRAVRSRQLRAMEAQERMAAMERDREEQLRAVLSDERARIARELHDIVAHGVSLMTLQAGAARQTVDRDAHRAKELLQLAEGQGRQALAEMQRLLCVLRRGDEGGPGDGSPVGLHAVADLVEEVRRTGIAVGYRVEGEQRQLAPGLEVSGYRIVQEALTNVVKHARASRAEVLVRYAPDHLELVITDDGRGADGGTPAGGHGLVGMRERAALFGGAFEVGCVPPHGWRVRACIPEAAGP
jgi:signal transduction histidine kinase